MTTEQKIIGLAREHWHGDSFNIEYFDVVAFYKAAQNEAYEKAAQVCELAVEQCKDAETKLDTTELWAKAIITGAIYQANKLAAAIKALKEQS